MRRCIRCGGRNKASLAAALLCWPAPTISALDPALLDDDLQVRATWIAGDVEWHRR